MYKQKLSSNQGGVAFRVLISVLTLTVLAFAIIMLLRTFESDKQQDLREAVRVAAIGLQEAVEKLEESPEWSTAFEDEPFEDSDSRYSVTFSHEERDGGTYLVVTSVGTSGSMTQTETLTLRKFVDENGKTRWVPERGEVGTLGELILDGDVIEVDTNAIEDEDVTDDAGDNAQSDSEE